MTACSAGMRSRWPPKPWRPTSADTAAGKDALLVCDTSEMADALNQRLHHDPIDSRRAHRHRGPRAPHRRR